MSLYTTTAALSLPDECLLGVLGFLWNDHGLVDRFHERRSQRTATYDQRRVHQRLRTRDIAPLHVCRSWRACSLPRFFRHVVIDLRHPPPAPLPASASFFVTKLFVLVPDSSMAHAAQLLRWAMPMVLPRTRVLALCLTEDNHYHQATNASLELAASLRKLVPGASSIWLQSLGPFGESSRDLVNALSPPPSNPGPSTPLPRVTSINLAVAGATAATDVIRRNAADLQYLVLGRVSGGVLHSLVFPRHTALEGDHHHQRPPVWYPKLLRLVFSVKPGAHIYAGPQSSRQNPFPQLEELHFDDTLANGLPLEEWYAPLYDTLLRYESMRLQYLTFPIVYNTQRTVGRRNCPSLVGLRHIKCCWATGLWSAAQSDSDSTRVLKAIAEIPTLECYVHPSYIARLSSMPAKIYCRNLKHLDLFGWPLTLVDLEWILLSFGKLQTLRVTLTHSVENQYLHSAPPPVDCEALGMSAVACLTVGDVNGGLAQDELERLREIMASLPALTSASLYRQALVFVREAQSSSPSATSASMDHVQIVDLEGTLYGQAAGSSSQGFQSPLSQLAAGADVPPLNDITSWNVVHELLADE